MIAVCPLLYLGWKFVKKTKIYSAEEIDLQKNLDEIEVYERSYVPNSST
jgi:amino acid transporter